MLQRHGHDLVVVTSRQLHIEAHTRAWITRHYDTIFREVVFGNHWGKEGKKVSKKDLCRALGASVLIDDSLAYTREAAADGIQAILFDLDGKYAWNKIDHAYKPVHDVIRVRNWQETVNMILKLA